MTLKILYHISSALETICDIGNDWHSQHFVASMSWWHNSSWHWQWHSHQFLISMMRLKAVCELTVLFSLWCWCWKQQSCTKGGRIWHIEGHHTLSFERCSVDRHEKSPRRHWERTLELLHHICRWLYFKLLKHVTLSAPWMNEEYFDTLCISFFSSDLSCLEMVNIFTSNG